MRTLSEMGVVAFDGEVEVGAGRSPEWSFEDDSGCGVGSKGSEGARGGNGSG